MIGRRAAWARALAFTSCLAAAVPEVPRPAAAQSASRGIEFEDLGFTERTEVGVRATGTGAFAATVNDVTALVLNGAGLARVKRIHGALVLSHERSRVDLAYGGAPLGRDVGATRLQFAGAAVPVPVLRGSLVPAVSVHRAFSSARDLRYSRDNIPDGRRENYTLQQSGATYAYSLGVGSDLSPTFSVGASLYLLDGRIDQLRQADWQPLVTDPNTHTFVLEDVESDVSGYGARVGALLYLNERLRIGVQFHSPSVVNVRTSRLREETRTVENDVGLFVRERVETATEYILPYRVDAAIAVPAGALLIGAQLSYARWQDSAVDGGRILTRRGDFVLGRVVSFAAGVEWTPRPIPLRVRAGVEHGPSPLKYLQADRVDDDSLVPVRAQSGRTRLSAGAGVLFRSSMTIDAAFTHTAGSCRSDVLSDEYRATAMSLSGSYWF